MSRGVLYGLCVSAMIAGAAAFLAGVSGADPQGAWLDLLWTFVFWDGLAFGVLACVTAFRTAQARWTAAVNRLGQAACAFLPLLFLVLLALLGGARRLFPWAESPVPSIRAWLDWEGMAAREVILFLALSLAVVMVVRLCLLADGRPGAITARDHCRITAWAVAAVGAYAVGQTVFSWDFVMSLAPPWYSTMFGLYFFVTSFYLGLAVLVLMASGVGRAAKLEAWLTPRHYRDLGNLMLGFSLFSMGCFFAQYLTIWYDNLHHETSFLLARYVREPWQAVGWAAFFIGYAVPFLALRSVPVKTSRPAMTAVSLLVVAGLAAERYVLVVPSLRAHGCPLSAGGVLIFAGFLGAFVLSVSWFLGRYPLLSAADEALAEKIEREEPLFGEGGA